MANIVELEDFKCEATIPGMFPAVGSLSPNNVVIQEKVKEFRDKYEKNFLNYFFDNDPDSKVTFLSNTSEVEKLKPAIVNYIAYYYLRNDTVANTPIGAVIKQGENGRKTNNTPRLCKLFNEAVKISRDTYISYFKKSCPINEIFKPLNEFNF
jgi:hypothetical protein